MRCDDLELFEEANVVLVKLSDIGDVVPAHAKAFDAKAKRKPSNLFSSDRNAAFITL